MVLAVHEEITSCLNSNYFIHFIHFFLHFFLLFLFLFLLLLLLFLLFLLDLSVPTTQQTVGRGRP